MKIGQSSDIHPLKEGRPLILGGVTIPSPKGLDGHSDGDALTHAIAEAIIGALGLGDLGQHFSDTSEDNKNIYSIEILRQVKELMKKEGYTIGNVDSLIMIEEPKLSAYKKDMIHLLSSALDCDSSLINVKATRGEKLGFIGRGEGVMAQAVVLLKKI